MNEANREIALEVFRASLPARGAKTEDDRLFPEAFLPRAAGGRTRALWIKYLNLKRKKVNGNLNESICARFFCAVEAVLKTARPHRLYLRQSAAC
jgi:hypothetical protein